jgi:di/tricarboxylate transporter
MRSCKARVKLKSKKHEVFNFMRREIFLAIIFIFCLFQATLLDYFKIFGVKPDILLISLVLASLSFDLNGGDIINVESTCLSDMKSKIYRNIVFKLPDIVKLKN